MPNPKANVLVVDDQPDNIRALSIMLQDRGYKVRQATTGRIALRTVSSDPPDLILLDIRMPQMDGYEICTVLKQSPQTSEIPIIFISALDETVDKLRAFDLGGADYITKPFQIQEVLARVNHQITIRQQQQQLTHLYERFRLLNVALERQVKARTLELELALEFEMTLKRITDRVRDSLDENQILTTVVENLMEALHAQCCDVVLWHPGQSHVTICHKEQQDDPPSPCDAIIFPAESPTVYEQLQQGVAFSLCRYARDSINTYSAMLVCPIWDDQILQGALWLFKPRSSSYGKQEVRLVEQVANQCGIALRQAKLYQEAQAQITELQRLHQLKEHFLSTISHELRTPVSNMRMVLQLLMIATNDGQNLLERVAQPASSSNRVAEYLAILQTECEREIHLIQDVLDLLYLEAGTRPLELVTIDLGSWMLHLIETFTPQFEQQQQTLEVQIPADLPAITTDLSNLNRIVSELLTNACKYTPAGETIYFAAQVVSDESPEQIQITVSNSGVEISPMELSRIFDKFYRIPNQDPWKYSGTGLGLALVQKLVEQLQGTIAVTSGDNQTRFSLTLPLESRQYASLI